MKAEFIACFAAHLRPCDRLCLCDPLYLGGTTDRSVSSTDIVDALVSQGVNAAYFPSREACADSLVAQAQSGDTILILGARDDTLPAFAQDVLGLCAR